MLSKFLVCQTQIINGLDRPDPTDHKYLKLKRVKFNEKKTYPETLKPQPRLKCYLYHNFFFGYQSCQVDLSNLSFIFPCIKYHLVQCQHSHALFDAHVHSERDITDTQSRYANRRT